MGGPLLQAFGPKEGRALSRGKGAARPSRLRRLVRSGNGPFRGRSRLAMPIIISGVSGCQVIQSCLHASKIAQEGPYRIDQRRRIVDGRSDRPKLTARERSVSLARGRHGLTVPGKALPKSGPRRSSRVHGCPISLRGSEHVRSQGIVPDSPTKNLILVHSTGPVLLSGVDLERLRHDGGPEGSAILSNCTCPLSAEHRDCGGLAGPLVLG